MKLEGTCRDHFVQPHCLGRATWSRVPMARWLLNVSKDGDSTTSFGNLCQHLDTFTVKTILWYSDRTCLCPLPLQDPYLPLSSLMFQCTAVKAVKPLVHGHPLLGIQLVSLLPAFIYCPSCYNIFINSQKNVLSLLFSLPLQYLGIGFQSLPGVIWHKYK